jgi:translocator protein
MTHLSTRADLLRLAACLAVTFSAAWIGSVASGAAPEFYASLERPAWAPPAWLFGPVWTVLYAMMAVAAWLVWRSAGQLAPRPTALYLGQLVLNALWSWLFFQWQLGAAALAEIIVLWVAIAATAWVFSRFSTAAAVLLMPYLSWVTYAAALTAALWRANPHLL